MRPAVVEVGLHRSESRCCARREPACRAQLGHVAVHPLVAAVVLRLGGRELISWSRATPARPRAAWGPPRALVQRPMKVAGPESAADAAPDVVDE
jgi:hypothetical protein